MTGAASQLISDLWLMRDMSADGVDMNEINDLPPGADARAHDAAMGEPLASAPGHAYCACSRGG